MDWLRDQLAGIYETKMIEYADDPWNLRNEYISVILDRNTVENFLASMVRQRPSDEEKVTILKLLEMQRHSMLMYTSCAWFFDDISGIEAVQILSYACRAMQLATEVAGNDFEPTFKGILEKAPTNVREFANGKEVYEALVRPNRTDLNRVGAHFALSSVFADYSDESDIFCYSAKTESYERFDAGIQVLATGRATIQSKIVLETHPVDFAVLHLGDHNLIGEVSTQMPDAVFASACKKLKEAFDRGDTTDTMRLMNVSFGGNSYSLWHLFKDEQRRILYQLLQTVWQEIEASFRHIYEHNYTIIQMIRGMGMPLPKALSTPAEFILNQEICRVIQDDQTGSDQLQKLVDEAKRLSLQLDEATLRFQASHKIDRLVAQLEDSPHDLALLESLEATLRVLLKAVSSLDLQTPQNVFFRITKETYVQAKKKADSGQAEAKRWVELMTNLADYLGVAIA